MTGVQTCALPICRSTKGYCLSLELDFFFVAESGLHRHLASHVKADVKGIDSSSSIVKDTKKYQAYSRWLKYILKTKPRILKSQSTFRRGYYRTRMLCAPTFQAQCGRLNRCSKACTYNIHAGQTVYSTKASHAAPCRGSGLR